MGKTAKTAMTLEDMPIKKPTLKRKFAQAQTNDMTLLPTRVILWRIYKRHQLGVWQAITVCVVGAWIVTSTVM